MRTGVRLRRYRFLIGAPRANTIHCASGDQIAAKFSAALVTRVLTPRARSSIQTSRVPTVLLRRMRVPSGDSDEVPAHALDAARRRRLAVERDPDKIAIGLAERARDVGQRAGRDVEVRAAREIRDHVVDDGNRRTRDRQAVGIERRRQQSFRPRVEQVAAARRRIWHGARVAAALDEHAMLALARALHGDSRRLPAGVVPDAEEHRRTPEPIARGQRWLISPAASVRERLRRAADRRHARQADVVRRRQQNRVVGQPRFAARCAGVGQRDRRAAVERHFLQLAVGKEPNPAPVRREEGIGRILGAGQRNRLEAIERHADTAGLVLSIRPT